jgi:CRP-like cAMP-binding protein
MGRKRFIAEQVIVKLREVEIIESKGLTQVEVAKKLGLCEKTLVRSRKELVDQAKRFKELEKKTFQLKGLLANLILDKLVLKEMLPP